MQIKQLRTTIKKYLGPIFIGSIIILFLILGIFGINFGQWLADSILWFYDSYDAIGIYLGVFLISIFGNLTVIFPVPYVIALIVVSAVIGYPSVNPFLLGIIGGLGAGVGEVSAWLIGRGSQNVIQNSKRIENMKRYVDKGWAPLLIFIFAATPLPDDAFLIVLGLASYSIIKTLIYCFLGKFVLCFLSSALPIWFANTALGDFLFSLFGIDLQAAKTGIIPATTPLEIIQSSIIWAATIIIMFLVVYVDWSKVFEKVRRTKPHQDELPKLSNENH